MTAEIPGCAGDGEACTAGFTPESGEHIEALEESLCADDYDNDRQRALAENLARREADQELIAALARDGFTGPAQETFEAELAAYAYPVMMAWTRTGEIIRRCRERGRPIGIADTGAGWSRDDRCELSTETVARALDFFRDKILIPGAWDPARGATIKTYFVGACLFQFPNVYQRWATERRNWKCECLLDHPGDPAGILDLAGDSGADERIQAREELDLVLAELDEKFPGLRRVAELRAQGYSDAEAARLLGMSPRAVEGQWYRFRKSRQASASQEGGDPS